MPDSLGLAIFNDEKLWINWLEIDNRKIPIPEIGGEYFIRSALPPRREGTKGGLGLVLGSLSDGRSVGGVDLDGCLVDGALLPWAQAIVDEVGSYTEISPSGTGVKIFFILDEKTAALRMFRKQVQWPKHPSQKKSWGIECYLTGGRFFTVTGRVYHNNRLVTEPTLKKLKFVNEAMKDFDASGRTLKNVIRAVGHWKNDDLPWDDWNVRGMALHNATLGGPAGQEAWIAFSQRCNKYEEKETLERWAHYARSPGDYVGYKDVINWGKEGGYEPEDDIADELGCKEQVVAMNETWAHVRIGKNYFILHDVIREGTLYSILNTKAWVEGESGFSPKFGTKQLPLHQIWLESRYRRRHTGIILAPPGSDPYPESYFNIYRGWAVKPTRPATVGIGAGARGWDLFKAHLFYIICNRNKSHWHYLRRWMAHKFQFPGKKLGVALVLKGEKGAGKTVVADYLKKIFGAHFVRVSQEDHFLGKFNAHLEHALIVNAEEAFWAGKKKAEGVLKDLITGSSIQVERKGVDTYTARNSMDVVITSNSDWVVPASHDERRYYVLEVSDEVVGNFAYFSELFTELEGNGPGAMLYDLLAEDLSGFEPRSIPETNAMWDQKLQSMPSHEKYVLKLLEEARVPHMDENFVVEKRKLYERYRDWCANNDRRHDAVNDVIFFKLLVKLGCHTQRPRIQGEQVAVLKFEPLNIMRETAVNKHFNYSIDWGDQEGWWVSVAGGKDKERKNLDF